MSFFPPDYKPAAGANTKADDKPTGNTNYIDQSRIGDGEKAVMIICGQYPDHVISGKSYWTHAKDGERAVQKKFPFHKGVPSNYKDEIQLNYDATKKRKVVYGQHTEKDLAYPRSFVSFVAYFNKANNTNKLNVLENYPDLLEQSSFKIVTFDRNDLRESLEDTLSMESYFAHPTGIHNFKVTLKRKGTGTDTSYTLTPELLQKTPAAVSKAWAESKDTIWLPALYEQGDPFKGKPAEPKEPACGLPPTKRDDYGADQDIASASTSKDEIGDDWS